MEGSLGVAVVTHVLEERQRSNMTNTTGRDMGSEQSGKCKPLRAQEALRTGLSFWGCSVHGNGLVDDLEVVDGVHYEMVKVELAGYDACEVEV